MNSEHTTSISDSMGLCRANASAVAQHMNERAEVYMTNEGRFYFRLSGDPRKKPNDAVVWPEPRAAA